MNPLVTIAIALYNNEKHIQRCIQSVINQTYNKLEIIIVDDGSTDLSRDKAQYFKDNRITIINKENEGLSSARQRALDVAKGEFISFIDADDYLKPDYVDKMLVRIQRDQSDVCICSTIFEDEDGRPITYDTSFFKAKEYDKPIKGNSNQVRWLYLSDSWNKMYRLSFLKKCKIIFEMPKGLNGTDRAFNMKLYVHQPLYSSISDQCYVHVIYKKSAVHRKNKDLLKSYMTIIEQTENECKKSGTLKLFDAYLNIHYYLFLRSSFQDIYNETTGLFPIYKQFRSIFMRHHDFIQYHPQLNQPIMKGTKSYILFIRFFIHFKPLLPLYFWLRDTMMK